MLKRGRIERIIESIRKAKELGAALRVGPELEITGYGYSFMFYVAFERTVTDAPA